MADWKITAQTLPFSAVGSGLIVALGTIEANVSSGLTINGSGQIAVKNGSGIAFDGSGNVTVNAGVGLSIVSGFLTVGTGTGLATSGGSVYIPGGAITNALLGSLAVATGNIQAGAVTATQIASATTQQSVTVVEINHNMDKFQSMIANFTSQVDQSLAGIDRLKKLAHCVSEKAQGIHADR